MNTVVVDITHLALVIIIHFIHELFQGPLLFNNGMRSASVKISLLSGTSVLDNNERRESQGGGHLFVD